MNVNDQLEQLEKAIFQRAQSLAEGHRQTAQQQQEKIKADTVKRLQIQEDRETAVAKRIAEQAYRRHVQASEIKMQAELDQLRWTLIQETMDVFRKQLGQLAEQQTTYVALLKQYLTHAVHLFSDNELVVEVNHRDHTLLASQWTELTQVFLPKQCTLSSVVLAAEGGLRVRTSDNRIRIDNTFEGLIERLEDLLYQTITAELFASTKSLRNI